MARQLAERTHDPMNLVSISYYQGCLALALALGQAEEGCRILEESIPLADAFAPIYGARLRCLLAEAAVRRADLTQARRWVDDTVAQPLVDRLDLARARCRLARARGGHHLARQLADEGLESARRCGAQLVVVDFLELLGVLAADRERCVEAGRLLGAAGRGRQRLGYVPFVMDRRDVAATIERIEAALGPSGRSAAWSVSGRGFLPRRGRRLRPPGTRPARPPRLRLGQFDSDGAIGGRARRRRSDQR
jgi:hypothetical protein